MALSLLRHPAALTPRYRGLLLWLGAGALGQIAWAVWIFYTSTHPPAWLRPYSNPHYHPGVLYSVYSALHGAYLLIAVGLCTLLASRGWLRAAALGSAIPFFGIGFGLFQSVPGWLIFRELRQERWVQFFAWRERRGFGNDLTPRSGS